MDNDAKDDLQVKKKIWSMFLTLPLTTNYSTYVMT